MPTVVTYSILIHGLCNKRDLEKANDLFQEMEERGCAPNVVTYNTLMRGFFLNNELPKVVELLHKMVEKNVSPDASTASIVVDVLSKDEKYRKCLNWLPTFPPQKPEER